MHPASPPSVAEKSFVESRYATGERPSLTSRARLFAFTLRPDFTSTGTMRACRSWKTKSTSPFPTFALGKMRQRSLTPRCLMFLVGFYRFVCSVACFRGNNGCARG